MFERRTLKLSVQIMVRFLAFTLLLCHSFLTAFAQNHKLQARSVQIDKNWQEIIQFLGNRGEDKVSFLAEIQKMLSEDYLKTISNFPGASETRISLSAFEFRSRDVFDAIKKLLESGFNIRLVIDSSFLHYFTPLSEEEVKALPEFKKNYYFQNYDLNGDGKVDVLDAEEINLRRKYSSIIWEWMKELKEVHSEKLELITSPYEMLPANDKFNYPRIHHWKEYKIQFLKQGKWLDQETIISSANLTDACLDKRMSSSYANYLRFIRAPKNVWDDALQKGLITNTSYQHYLNAATDEERFKLASAKGSTGHIQFGFKLKGELSIKEKQALFQAILGPTELWPSLYQQNLHFDSAPIIETANPEIVLKNPATGERTTIQAFYSEGMLQTKANSDLIQSAFEKILSERGNQIKVFKSTQFTWTHTYLNQILLERFIHDELDELFLAVDSNFAVQEYSALTNLLVSKINNAPLTRSEVALTPNKLGQEQKQKFFDSISVFDGNSGVFGAIGNEGDKLHSKLTYLEYIDPHHKRHYVIIAGSGNFSTNAGKLNADGLFVFDSTDVEFKNIMERFFTGVKTEETKRLRRFTQYYLMTYVNELFKEKLTFKGLSEGRAVEKTLVQDFALLLEEKLSGDEKRVAFTQIMNSLKTLQGKTQYGDNLLLLLQWFEQNNLAPNLDQFHQILFAANPTQNLNAGLRQALIESWSLPVSMEAQNNLITALKMLAKVPVNQLNQLHSNPIISEILNNCQAHFKKLGLDSDAQMFRNLPTEPPGIE